MGQKSFTCHCFGSGGKEKLKKMQTEFHKKQMCNEEVLEEITETAPPKKSVQRLVQARTRKGKRK